MFQSTRPRRRDHRHGRAAQAVGWPFYGVDGNLLVEELPHNHETVEAILNGTFKPTFWAQQFLAVTLMENERAKPAALEAYGTSLAIRDRLAKADPGNASWQTDLAKSLNKIGYVLRAQGNLAAALENYKASARSTL